MSTAIGLQKELKVKAVTNKDNIPTTLIKKKERRSKQPIVPEIKICEKLIKATTY